MDFNITAELLLGNLGALRRFRVADRIVAFQRKLGIDNQRRRVVGHVDDCIRSRSIRQCELELVGALGQSVLDDCLHPCLTESPARLLVGKNVLEFDHLAGQLGDVVLRGIDDSQPLLQFREVFLGRLGRFGDRLADTAGHGFQAIIDQAHHVRLPVRKDLRQCLHATGQFVLAFDQFRHAVLGLASPLKSCSLVCRLAVGRPPLNDDQDKKHEGDKPQKGDTCFPHREGAASHDKKGSGPESCEIELRDLFHVACLTDSGNEFEQKEQNRNIPPGDERCS